MSIIFGNAIVGQSGGPTSAINATLFGVIKSCYKSKDIIKNLYGMKNGIEGFLKEDFINLFSFFNNEKSVEALKSTPSSALGSCRMRLPSIHENKALYERIFDILQKYNIRYFFYIGGNDSMDTVNKLFCYLSAKMYEIRIIGIPKTIDNDLVLTDHTPGYGSCAKYIATTTEEILRDCAVYTSNAVTIIETMGRDTGWLSAATALCGVNGRGVDLIYLPEVPFSSSRFIQDAKNVLQKHPDAVIVVSEGIKYKDGKGVSQTERTDAFGHRQLSGAGRTLSMLVQQQIGCKSRAVELNLPQRCAAHLASETDIFESTLIGGGSVELALRGESGKMVTFLRSEGEYSVKLGSVDVAKAANKIKYVPPHFINEAGNGVTQACIEYIRPLIIGEHYPSYKNGLPIHLIID